MLHFTRGGDGHLCSGTPTLSPDSFHLLHDFHTFHHLPKYNVFTVQPRGDNGGDEELALCELVGLVMDSSDKQTCEPLVFGPALAMDKSPGLLCLNLKFSSTGTVGNGVKGTKERAYRGTSLRRWTFHQYHCGE